MDEVVEHVAYELSQKYGTNDVEREALYVVILSKLHKEKHKWRKLSSLSTFLKTVAYNAILNYKSLQKSWNDFTLVLPAAECYYDDEDCKRIENNNQNEMLLKELENCTTIDEYDIICMTFGLGNYEILTRKEIAEQTFISEGEQRTIVKRVLDRLKTNELIKELYKSL